MYNLMKRFMKKPKTDPFAEEFLKSKPLRNPSVKWSKAPNGEIGIRPISVDEKQKKKKNRLILLDDLGGFVWERCDGSLNVEEIARELSETYKITAQEAKISLSVFLQSLVTKRLIEIKQPMLKKETKEEEVMRKIRIP